MSSENQGISIVIATKGRVELLGELLESLMTARARFFGKSEVILVDDSNQDDAERIEDLCSTYDAKRIEFGPSVPMKRNIGVKASKYEIVLLLDSDCLATPDLLNEHYREYEDKTVGSVAGLLEFTGPDTWFWGAVSNSQFVVCFDFPRWMDTVPWTPTANCSVRRSVFLSVGGFDTSFPNKPGGEDVDLGLRITKSGLRMKCNPAALVYHQKRTWIPVKAMIMRLWNYGSADCFLMERHPDLLFPCYPRRTFIVILAIIVCSILAVSASPVALLCLLVFLVLDLFFCAFSMQLYEGRKATFFQQVVVQLLIVDNELGFLLRCLCRKKLGFMTKQLIYFEGQSFGIADRGSMLSIAHLISMLVMMLLLELVVL